MDLVLYLGLSIPTSVRVLSAALIGAAAAAGGQQTVGYVCPLAHSLTLQFGYNVKFFPGPEPGPGLHHCFFGRVTPHYLGAWFICAVDVF